ncbi:unnamed protein product [Auanema sp. JU1783]|nr:unnamed protein product [Auanema sp. JU1783]
MDDLLSVALSEAGLDEFFQTETPSDAVTGTTALNKDTSEVSSYNEEHSETPSNAVTPVSVENNGSPTSSQPPSNAGVTAEVPSAGNRISHSASTPVLPSEAVEQQTFNSNPVPENRNGNFPTVSSERVLSQPNRNIVQTANGSPLIRSFQTEDGQTIFRAVRATNGNSIRLVGRGGTTTGRTVATTISTESVQPSRVVVVRQSTPNGTVFVRKTVPPGSMITTSVGRGGTIIRRLVTRGGATGIRRGTVGATPINSYARTATSHNQIHVETGHQYTASTPIPSSRANPRLLRTRAGQVLPRGTNVYRAPASQIIPRTNGAYTPISSRQYNRGDSYVVQPLSRNAYPQRSGLMPIAGNSASYPNMFDENEAVDSVFEPKTVFRESNSNANEIIQGTHISRSHPQLSSLSIERRKPELSIRPAPSPRAVAGSEQFNSGPNSAVHSPSPAIKDGGAKAPPSKLQRAKDEMTSVIQASKDNSDLIDEEEENLGYAETYAEYRPSKLRSGLAHPDSVVETASLSSVQPPDVKYHCTIPEDLIDTGAISALQLEAVIYACQAHEQRLPSQERCGYLIGDGAGVGKGRTVACIIYENYMLGRTRSIWLSVSADLKYDSERDLRDIGAGRIKIYALNKLKYSKICGKENGSIKRGCIFATYSSLIGEKRLEGSNYRSRLKQLIQWFGVEYDGVIVLDECHRAKNLCPIAGGKPTKTGQAVLDLQRCLPNARVVYASATGATEPRNMAYMTRIGLWGPGQAFPEFSDFINAVERRGVGGMEIVAMDMKQRGLYLARQLSFRGVSFRVEEVPLSDEFIKMYDDSVKLWLECRRQFQLVLSTMSDEERSACKQVWGQFWACHQRFFKYLCIAAKVETCVKITKEALKNGKCAVIGLQSTGESRTLETLEELGGELTEFVSTAKAVLHGLIDKHFPTEKGQCVDVFRDFDRMFDDFDKPKKRKNKRRAGFDILDELGLGFGPTISDSPEPKRSRNDDDESRSVGSSDGSGSSDDSDTDGEVNLGDKEEDWLNALKAEAESSGSEDGNDDSDVDKDGDDDAKSSADDDDEFNPFNCDFSVDDPWAAKQQVIEDSPEKKPSMTEEELLLRKERRRERKRKRRMEKEKEKKVAAKKREINSQAMKSTATQFLSSSRIIDDSGMGSDINPQMIKAELLAAVERLGPALPANTLDQLIDELGGPEFVAEMTGRKGRVVTREDGEVAYELRSAGADVPLELMNMDEKDKFMKGDKLVAVISEAASSGISLQSDRRAHNQRRRVHITLELPWSADKAIQQFGRTHRSNQVSAPEYIFLISELAGEKRFASIVAKRLESLGALTHGDRRATESRDLSQFNLDNKYGRYALDVLLRTVVAAAPPLIPAPEYKPGDFFADMRLYMEGVGLLSRLDNGQYVIEREAATIPKFLNRILGLPVHAQNALFGYFTDIVSELIKQAKHDGTYDMGIMDLGTGGDQVRKLETRVFLGRMEKGSFRVEIHKIGVERGVSWEDAFAIYHEHNVGEDGFYVSTSSGRKTASLVYGIGKKRLETGARLYAITRPSTGRSPKLETYSELSKRFTKVTPDEAKQVWLDQYDGANQMCQHSFVHGKCRNEQSGVYCEVGRRTRTYFVLSGSVLSVWPVVEDVLSGKDRRASRMQVIRVRTDQDQKIVGLLVLPQFVRNLVTQLEIHCGRCFVENEGNK